jgi:hypothetical protein
MTSLFSIATSYSRYLYLILISLILFSRSRFCKYVFYIQSKNLDYVIDISHQQLAWTEITPLQAVGQNDSGAVFEQQIQFSSGLPIRRVVIRLQQPTRHGDMEVAVLTNVTTQPIA